MIPSAIKGVKHYSDGSFAEQEARIAVTERIWHFPVMEFKSRIDGWYELDPVARPGRTLRGLLIALPVVWLLQGPLHLLEWGTLLPGDLAAGRLLPLLTYGWLHENLLHLLFNMLGLWVFGAELERLWGPRAFFVYWVACLTGAGVAHVILDPLLSEVPAGVIGASGGVYGLIAAYGSIFRRRKLLLLGLFPVGAGTLAIGFAALALFSGVFQSSDGVAHFAHLGGMATGLAILHARPAWRSLRLWRHRQRMLAYLRQREAAGGKPVARAEPPRGAMPPVDVDARVDELLEKISRAGIEALDPEERRFLDEAARYKRKVREQGGKT